MSKARLPSRTGLSPSSSRRCAARSRYGPNEIGCPSMGHGRLIRSFYPILLNRLAPATDVTAWQARRCRLWVKRVGFVMSPVCPVYPKQQTSPDTVGTSHLCHLLTQGARVSGGAKHPQIADEHRATSSRRGKPSPHRNYDFPFSVSAFDVG